MKKGRILMLSFCALSLFLVLGIFIGRNLRGEFWNLPTDTARKNVDISQPAQTGEYRLNINTATKVQLMELPGIGEVLAERILTYREEFGSFDSVDSLLEVSGLGTQKLQAIESLIKVE